ncbi:ribonuclease PH [bacterium]|nr:ribonuclease PH [bacterium]
MAKCKTTRPDGRLPNALRPIRITRRYTSTPHGSVLIKMGKTHVLCTAMVEGGVPPFLRDKPCGWVTAEYGMLPGSTQRRKSREASLGRVEGRTQEIKRLIGRSMRSVVDRNAFPGHTIWLDCDVLQADGGTRTASVTGAYVALVDALAWMKRQGIIDRFPLRAMVAAVSVGVVDGQPLLDLCYREDSAAEVDMNVVATDGGGLIEVQGTGEQRPFTSDELDQMLALARHGVDQLFALQAKALRWREKPWD